MSIETVARRYAAALADVVTKTGDAQSVQTELKVWETMMTSNAQLREVFSNPAIAHKSKENLLENLIEKSKPSKTAANFLRVLLQNHRLTEISEINDRFTSVLEERSGGVKASVTSARPLSDAEKAELQANLEKLTGKRVSAKFETDENIIGGVIARIGSTVYDGSVKTKLEELKQQMIGN
ncbi:MAG TPA: ATP synthase F1 subunit delta [Pyrinomonadaceae bacterium]